MVFHGDFLRILLQAVVKILVSLVLSNITKGIPLCKLYLLSIVPYGISMDLQHYHKRPMFVGERLSCHFRSL